MLFLCLSKWATNSPNNRQLHVIEAMEIKGKMLTPFFRQLSSVESFLS